LFGAKIVMSTIYPSLGGNRLKDTIRSAQSDEQEIGWLA